MENSDRSVRKYEKPKLKVIELAAEEVLNIGCKVTSGFVGSSSLCGGIAPCSATGTS